MFLYGTKTILLLKALYPLLDKTNNANFCQHRFAAMAVRGCAAFSKKVNAAPPGTFLKFEVRHGSKPWTL